MGAFAEGVKRIVTGIGNIFKRVINWFKEFLFGVNQKTENFINSKKEEILKCDEPEKVTQYLGAESHYRQTKQIADNFKKDLTPGDLERATKLSKEMNM